MSINQSYAINKEKSRRFGKYLSTIDFDLVDIESQNANSIQTFKKSSTVGNLCIGGKEFELTGEEIDYLIETLQNAQSAFLKKYRLGKFGI
jgi:hypothetical protein